MSNPRLTNASEVTRERAARESAEARLAAALDSLHALVAYVERVGGYMKPQDQSVLHAARAVLVERGR